MAEKALKKNTKQRHTDAISRQTWSK